MKYFWTNVGVYLDAQGITQQISELNKISRIWRKEYPTYLISQELAEQIIEYIQTEEARIWIGLIYAGHFFNINEFQRNV